MPNDIHKIRQQSSQPKPATVSEEQPLEATGGGFRPFTWFINGIKGLLSGVFTPIKLLLVVSLLAAMFLGGMYVAKRYYEVGKPVVQDDSQVILQRIKKVCKLVTVEGHFTEIFTRNSYQYFDISFFQKRAIIKADAKVSVGLDMAKVKFTTFPSTKKMVISNLPTPTILSIDTDFSYYDITEGSFNQFTPDELTDLQKTAKEKIREKAQSSELMLSAQEQGNTIFELIEVICREAGWEVEYNPPRAKVSSDNSLPTIDSIR
jgi:hypothetical protein